METGSIILIVVGAIFLGLIIGYFYKLYKKNQHPVKPSPERPKEYLSFLEEVRTVLRNKKTKRTRQTYFKSVRPRIDTYHIQDYRFAEDFYGVLLEFDIEWYEL